MAYGLLKRILAHAAHQGWIKQGQVIVDPFGGIGSTAILGAYEGYQVVCCELESRFVGLAEQNFLLHAHIWKGLGCPQPVILQGDSRRLCEVVEKAELIVSSPPFVEVGTGKHCNRGLNNQAVANSWARKGKPVSDLSYADNSPGQLAAMKPGDISCVISSPPYAETLKGDGTQSETASESRAKRNTPGGSLGQSQRTQGYGSDGNLGNLKPGDVSCVISSPPYSSGDSGSAQSIEARTDKSAKWIKANTGSACNKGYGTTHGNLGNLKPGDVSAIISSPPYEDAQNAKQDNPEYRAKFNAVRDAKYGKGHSRNKFDQAKTPVGETNGQLGNDKGDTFWAAAAEIVQQCYHILKPGGHAIWVVKSFVRKGKRVDFPGDWRRLCESVGFTTVCEHHAMLVKETRTDGLFGEIVEKKERKSFFRRLAEAKGSPPIDYEVVICCEKPLANHIAL